MTFFVIIENSCFFYQKTLKQKLSSDPRDLPHELRVAPERVVAPGMRKTDGCRPVPRPFFVRFDDFEFPAALAHFFRANVAMFHTHTGAGGGGGRAVAGGSFARKSGATGS